jgi:hypothetical protein
MNTGVHSAAADDDENGYFSDESSQPDTGRAPPGRPQPHGGGARTPNAQGRRAPNPPAGAFRR